jgi:hypothetical protein
MDGPTPCLFRLSYRLLEACRSIVLNSNLRATEVRLVHLHPLIMYIVLTARCVRGTPIRDELSRPATGPFRAGINPIFTYLDWIFHGNTLGLTDD